MLRNKQIAMLLAVAVLLCAGLATRAEAPSTTEATKTAPAEPDKWSGMKADAKRQKIDAVAGEAIETLFKGNPKAKELFSKAHGYAVFDSLKMGFFLSGSGGKGVAVESATKKRTYMSMGSAGVGLSFGGQKSQIVFLFQDSATFKNFVEKGWTADASATATAGDEGAGAGTRFVNGIAVYQLGEKGLMASADVSGTKFWKDKDLN